MSALALSSWLAEAKSRDSPSRGWRSGSRITSGQTSARSYPVKSLTSLCRRMGKVPLGQFRAWLMEKALPHSHLVSNFLGIHPYLRHKASRNAPLWSTNPWRSSGNAVSQFDAPLSLISLAVLPSVSGSVRLFTFSSTSLSRFAFNLDFLFFCQSPLQC